MSALRRAINLILPLALVAIGGGGLFYFYFLTATPNGWMALAAGIVGGTFIVVGVMQMQQVALAPPRTMATIEENIQWAKTPTR